MKRLLGVVVLGLVVVLGSVAAPSVDHVIAPAWTATVHAAQNPASIIVYITRTGAKYHRDGCRYLSQSKIETTLKDALAKRLGPCGVCKPPTIPR